MITIHTNNADIKINKNQVFIFIIGFLLIFCAVVLAWLIKPDSIILKITLTAIGEAGFALVIAIILSLTVERQFKEEFHKDTMERQETLLGEVKEREEKLSKSIFDYLYSIRLDYGVFQSLEKYIFQQPFYRKNLQVDYRIEETSGDWILLEALYSYTDENISNEGQDYKFSFKAEKPLGDPPVSFSRDVGLAELYLGRQYSIEEINKSDQDEDDSPEFTKYSVALTLHPGETVEVRARVFLAKRKQDAELYRTSRPSDRLRASFTFDPERFELMVEPLHPSNPKPVDRVLTKGRVVVDISEPLLPKQGVFFWWCDKRCTVPDPQPTADPDAASTARSDANRASQAEETLTIENHS